jgi:hypothetical protein
VLFGYEAERFPEKLPIRVACIHNLIILSRKKLNFANSLILLIFFRVQPGRFGHLLIQNPSFPPCRLGNCAWDMAITFMAKRSAIAFA